MMFRALMFAVLAGVPSCHCDVSTATPSVVEQPPPRLVDPATDPACFPGAAEVECPGPWWDD